MSAGRGLRRLALGGARRGEQVALRVAPGKIERPKRAGERPPPKGGIYKINRHVPKRAGARARARAASPRRSTPSTRAPCTVPAALRLTAHTKMATGSSAIGLVLEVICSGGRTNSIYRHQIMDFGSAGQWPRSPGTLQLVCAVSQVCREWRAEASEKHLWRCVSGLPASLSDETLMELLAVEGRGHSVVHLCLHRCRSLTNACIPSLGALPGLETLNIDYTALSLRELATALRGKNLSRLEFRDAECGPEGAEAVLAALELCMDPEHVNDGMEATADCSECKRFNEGCNECGECLCENRRCRLYARMRYCSECDIRVCKTCAEDVLKFQMCEGCDDECCYHHSAESTPDSPGDWFHPCSDCGGSILCDKCAEYSRQSFHTCSECGKDECSECGDWRKPHWCEKCNKFFCNGCSHEGVIATCKGCKADFCSDCAPQHAGRCKETTGAEKEAATTGGGEAA